MLFSHMGEGEKMPFFRPFFTEGNGSYSNSGGILISPSYPNAYPPGLDCIYLISQPNGTIVNLTIMFMDIDCQEIGTLSDNFEMRDGMSGESPLMGIICGNRSTVPASIQTTQKYLWIRYKVELGKS